MALRAALERGIAAVGVDFVSCTEAFDASTPTGRLLLQICAAFGPFERDVIIERTVAGLAAAKRRGVRIGRPKRRVDVDVVEAMLAEGKSLTCIARDLRMGFDTLRKALGAAPLKGPSAGAFSPFRSHSGALTILEYCDCLLPISLSTAPRSCHVARSHQTKYTSARRNSSLVQKAPLVEGARAGSARLNLQGGGGARRKPF